MSFHDTGTHRRISLTLYLPFARSLAACLEEDPLILMNASETGENLRVTQNPVVGI
jgi:hypothetical protein